MKQYYDPNNLRIGQHVGMELDPYTLNYPLNESKTAWVADQGGRSFVLRFYEPQRGELEDFLSNARKYTQIKHSSITPNYPPFYSNLWVFSCSAVCGGERLFSFLGKYPDGAPLNIVLSVFDSMSKTLDQVHERELVHGMLDLNSVHVVNGSGVMTGFGALNWMNKITGQDMDARFFPPEYKKRHQTLSPSIDRYMFMKLLLAALLGESILDRATNNLPKEIDSLSPDAWNKIKNWSRPAVRHRPKSLVEVMRILRADLYESTTSNGTVRPKKSKPRKQNSGGSRWLKIGIPALTLTSAAIALPFILGLVNFSDTETDIPDVVENDFQSLPQVLEEPLKDGGNAPKVEKIAPAIFEMGDLNGYGYENELPKHEVNIPTGFYLSKHEVTFAQYDRFAKATGRALPPDNGWGRNNRPVINISWYDAKAYAAWVSEQTGKSYRLPTEIEWEYSARAGSKTAYWYGDNLQEGFSVCESCGTQWDSVSSAPVGSQASNPFGLFDMHGNVAEWVEDCYHASYEGAPTTNSIWLSNQCEQRVLRGGSWFDEPTVGRSATRYPAEPDMRASNWGFRLVRVLKN
ncbi:formylglycine-generating enzyme family protein [Marinomonas mediterranea]|jgi:Uncharacterized conserved protein|uniref:Sulphatase-modifying factor protein n=1 Tax=Marinomonas mediterranea (strain ATCC 700492 / JCM 21426 / NBRC 103028 / MMB-1) TaxID=717774 RepID=F2JTJ5_MARM1|nr:formylglycine-generating enzyme family protein [Marinomonas mediterranea]ADZ91509.1 Sulphatase-modifying factor protein [Marinomonas mediterranea MMB-1]WCN09475.1 SUMF1/EgtB/PvdO family nonheme iron enzyme [Marinomonas mediterranea]WCN13552.1 SUMF1/EgtB/PvdO family nonheme iron enzyme [Marinomonas mediterranea]WCN17617.1 SUMF1/EgtB/PvdO family nonheme iron enzyme [Marinomonas mediterranea MMB-1]